MLRPLVEEYLLIGPAGPHGMLTVCEPDLAHYRQRREEVLKEAHKDGSVWTPVKNSLREVEVVTQSMLTSFTGRYGHSVLQ